MDASRQCLSDVATAKLGALKRAQRELNAYYDRLEVKANAVEGEVNERDVKANTARGLLERVVILFDGLKAATFAGRPLHTSLGAPQLLFREAATAAEGKQYDYLLQLWEAKLRKTLSQGRMRANVSALFGEVLAESEQKAAQPRYQDPVMLEERQSYLEDWLKKATAATPSAVPKAEFDKFFDPILIPGSTDAVPVTLTETRVRESFVEALLANIAVDIYADASIREAASAIQASGSKKREIAGALTIQLAQFSSWDWDVPVTCRAEYTRNRWRCYFDQPLLQRLFTDLIGTLWGIQLWRAFSTRKSRPTGEAFPLASLRASLLDNGPGGIPTDWSSVKGADYSRSGRHESSSAAFFLRARSCVDSQLTLNSAAKKSTAPVAVSCDVVAFGDSISHDAILEVLRRLDVAPEWLDFFGRYLRVKVMTLDKGVVRVNRGVPPDSVLGTVLSEIWMLCIEHAVFIEYNGLQCKGEFAFVVFVLLKIILSLALIRLRDDMFWTFPDESAAQQGERYLAKCLSLAHLELSENKAGRTVLHEVFPGRWKAHATENGGSLAKVMLQELRPNGLWSPCPALIVPVLAHLKRRLQENVSVTTIVSLYNAYARYLIQQLMVNCLCKEETEAVSNWIRVLQYHLFEEAGGIIEFLRGELQKRFTCFEGQQFNADSLAPSWFAFPLAAGGMGLVLPALVFEIEKGNAPLRGPRTDFSLVFQETGLAAKKQPVTPLDALRLKCSRQVDEEYKFFTHLQSQFYQRERSHADMSPSEFKDADLEQKLQVFMNRGTEINPDQNSLSDYWQWFLFSEELALTEAFGSFDFLFTELVPLETISSNRMGSHF